MMHKCFMTGCDKNTEWQLEWFVRNYKRFNNTPLVIADFGMTKLAYQYAKKHSAQIIHLDTITAQGWMLKPQAMTMTPANNTCWLDTDCEVLGNLDGIFDHVVPLKLSMCVDQPWSTRRKETWHNSGVVAFQGTPQVLRDWARLCQEKREIRGDQEVLHWMMGGDGLRRMSFIKDLPREYNTLRLDLVDGTQPKRPLIMHWTGQKGNDEIRKKMG